MLWALPIQYQKPIGIYMTQRPIDSSGTPGHKHGQRLDTDAEDKALKAVASGVAKCVLYICLTIFLCFYVSSCNLDSEVIQQCEASCSTSGNRMKSVSNSTCECISRLENEFGGMNDDIWVIPRSTNNSP